MNFPEAVDHAEVVGHFLRGPVAEAGFGPAQNLAVRVGVEAEDRAEVILRGIEQGEPVGLGAGQGLLVGIDLPLTERFEADPGQKPFAGMRLAIDLEDLMDEVVSGERISPEDLVSDPLLY